MSLHALAIADGGLQYDPAFIPEREADPLLMQLQQEVSWRQEQIRLFGRLCQVPRLQAFQGDPGLRYRYSHLSLRTAPWHPALDRLRRRLEQITGQRFNCVLLNLYRDGQDSMGWHSDDEAELGPDPVIASLSLGVTRRFLLRRRDDHRQKQELPLAHGSLLLMSGALQRHWQHSVPRSRPIQSARINLTFRNIVPLQ